MIAVSALLVFVAIALLVVGILKVFVLVYASIGASALAALLLGAGAFVRRAELFGRDDENEAVEGAELGSSAEHREETATPSARAPVAVGASAPAGGASGVEGEPSAPSSPLEERTSTVDVPADAPVHVVPSRRSYHLDNCRQLRTRENHTLTHADAVAEGYTACSACMPDTVLAARRSPGAVVASSGDEQRMPDAAPVTGESADEAAPTETAEQEAPAEDAAGGDAVGHEAVGHDAADQGSAGAATTASAATPTSSESGAGQAGLVGVVQDSRRYHRLTCAVIEDAVQDGIETSTLGRGEAEEQELVPCTVCRP